MDAGAVLCQALEIFLSSNLVHGKMFFVLGQAEMVLYLLVVYPENRARPGKFWLGRHLEQPLNGGIRFLFITFLSQSGRLVADDPHGIARGRVDRLGASVEQHWQLCETINVRLVGLGLGQEDESHEHPEGHDHGGNDGNG